MLRELARRVLAASALLLAVSLLAFLLVRALPGDPAQAILGFRATPEALATVRHQLGLDRPEWAQYLGWLADAVRGDFGRSIATTGAASGYSVVRVSDIVAQGMAVTLPITVLGTGLAALIGIPLGMVGAAWAGTVIDTAASAISVLGLSIPAFYLAYLLILVFTVQLGWLPSVGYVSPRDDPMGFLATVALPVLTVGVINAAPVARAARSACVGALASPSLALARIEGLPPPVIHLKHVLRRALAPVLTVLGLQIGYLFGGIIVIENMFAIPGMGRQLLIAAQQRDYPVLQALIVLFAAAFIVANLAVDLLQLAIDPRVRA
jgi:peptide/nickel transport system permease protein